MSDFNLEFQNFIDNRLNDLIDDLKKKNPEYAACREYIKENYDRVQSIIENFPEVDREFMRTYSLMWIIPAVNANKLTFPRITPLLLETWCVECILPNNLNNFCLYT